MVKIWFKLLSDPGNQPFWILMIQTATEEIFLGSYDLSRNYFQKQNSH